MRDGDGLPFAQVIELKNAPRIHDYARILTYIMVSERQSYTSMGALKRIFFTVIFRFRELMHICDGLLATIVFRRWML